jgi:hypothetical protein
MARELVRWLYRETSFPLGCVPMTGRGVVGGAHTA